LRSQLSKTCKAAVIEFEKIFQCIFGKFDIAIPQGVNLPSPRDPMETALGKFIANAAVSD
jgi:hypothetical protein